MIKSYLTAALLHDIARKEKNHAFVGAQKLRAMGYESIACLIETHMDIEVDAPMSANEVLFSIKQPYAGVSELIRHENGQWTSKKID